MPEFLRLLPPDEGREILLSHLSALDPDSELIDTLRALDRVSAQEVLAPHPLPEFPRSTVDGYAVRARDSFGATDSLPSYLELIGEVPMGDVPGFGLQSGQCALIHTGGMLPAGGDAVVMLEYTQAARAGEIEILRSVAEGDNVIRVGEDIAAGQAVIARGVRLRAAEIGGLLALGILKVHVARKPRVGLVSSGDELTPPGDHPRRGQVRDINAYTLSALVTKAGGEAVLYGIVRDQLEELEQTAGRALAECDVVVITAGSSASTRDMTSRAISSLGTPGVLVHGVNTRPGKPTILGACNGKAVIGLPGNPVSALVNGTLFLQPVIQRLLGEILRPHPTVLARLSVNLSSQAGREDWIPVKLSRMDDSGWQAEPIFGKSNLIFTLVAADGLLRIPPDATGLSAGEMIEVLLT